MVLHVVSCLLIFPILVSWGAFFSKIIRFSSSKLSTNFLIGVVGVCMIASLWAYILPISWVFEVIILTFGLVYFYLFNVDKLIFHSPIFKEAMFWVASIICVFISTFAPFILDHFGYYIPSIKWIQEFGWVQGVANIDLVLGQMSFWHLFQAVFSHISDPYLRINSLVLIGVLVYIFEKKSYYLLLFFPYLFFFVQSPSVDLPAQCFALILLNEVLHKNTNWSFLFGFSVFIFLIKPTLVWCPIFLGLLLVAHQVTIKNYLLGFGFFLVFIIKNLYIFAYPFFPIFQFGLHVPYKTNPLFAEQSNGFAIQKTFDMQYSISEIQSFSYGEFVWKWLTIEGYKSVLHFAFIISILLILLIAINKKSKLYWMLFVAIFIKSVFVLFFSAQFRFFTDVIFVFFTLILFQFSYKKLYYFVFIMGSSIVGILFFLPNQIGKYLPKFRLSESFIGFQKSQWKEPIYYLPQRNVSNQLGNFRFFTPLHYPYNFSSPLPSITLPKLKLYLKLGIFPQYKSIEKPIFKWIMLDELQKKHLKSIINHIENQEEMEKKH